MTSIEGTTERGKTTPPAATWQALTWLDDVPQLEHEVHDGEPTEQMHILRLSLHKLHICSYLRLVCPTHIVDRSMALGKKSGGRATTHALPYTHEECKKCCNAMAMHQGRYFINDTEPMELVPPRALKELMRPPKRPDANTADATTILKAQSYGRALWGLADQRLRSPWLRHSTFPGRQ